MRGLDFLKRHAAGFLAAEGGNFTVFTAMVLTVLMLSVGLGLNTVELALTRSNLQAALDAAVTSTARDLTTGIITTKDAKPSVDAFLKANSGTGFASTDTVSLDTLDVDQQAKTVSAEASVDVALLIPFFGGDGVEKVIVDSAAKYSDQTMEVSMVLDVTGSMNDNNKIGGLRTAATDAVHQLLDGQSATNPRVRVAVVPFANSVNAGSLAASSVFVEQTQADRKRDIPNTSPILASVKNRPDTCGTERKGMNQYTDVGPDTSMVHRDLLLTPFAANTGTAACPSASLVPLTTDANELTSMIGAFNASGGTAGHIGIQWGWYMLSPFWSSVLPTASTPANYDPTKVTKVMILMTDGEFNLSYFDAQTWRDAYNDAGKPSTVTAATTLCSAMKDKGIQIFTIGFGLPSDEAATARQTLKDCASPDTDKIKYFYEASSNADLDATFQAIVHDLQKELVLTK